MVGTVYIASMNLRGKWADCPENCSKLNVTSCQSKTSKNRRDFSPMTPIEGGYKGYWCYENRWQSGKRYQDIDDNVIKKYWKELKEPKRRYPKSKGKTVLYAEYDDIEGKLDYITSRKKVYVPEYYQLVKDRDMVTFWKNKHQNNEDIIIYDLDGPRDNNNEPICLKLTKDLLKNKINDDNHPFGHGYIVGSIILDISYDEYI